MTGLHAMIFITHGDLKTRWLSMCVTQTQWKYLSSWMRRQQTEGCCCGEDADVSIDKVLCHAGIHRAFSQSGTSCSGGSSCSRGSSVCFSFPADLAIGMSPSLSDIVETFKSWTFVCSMWLNQHHATQAPQRKCWRLVPCLGF